VTIFVLSFGLLEEIEDSDDDNSEESEYDEDAFVNDTFCDFKFDYFTLQVDNASKKGVTDRRFLNNDFVFDSAKNFELNLTQNFNINLQVDPNDFIYLYLLFTSSTDSILDEQDFSLRADLEESKDEYEVNVFFDRMLDRDLHCYFDTGLDIFYENLKFDLDTKFESKFFDFYKVKKTFINQNFLTNFSKTFHFPFNINLLNKPNFSNVQQDFFINKLEKHSFDNLVFRLYENKILKTKFLKRNRFNKELDLSFFEWVSYSESKIIRSSVFDVLLFDRFFWTNVKIDSYYEML